MLGIYFFYSLIKLKSTKKIKERASQIKPKGRERERDLKCFYISGSNTNFFHLLEKWITCANKLGSGIIDGMKFLLIFCLI
jgi:uncharacterized protein YgiM (DUF1202 family)